MEAAREWSLQAGQGEALLQGVGEKAAQVDQGRRQAPQLANPCWRRGAPNQTVGHGERHEGYPEGEQKAPLVKGGCVWALCIMCPGA